MNIQLSDHFTYSRLLRFVIPSIVMMIFTSIYSVVDGLFISNFVGKTPFAAVNLIMPFAMLLGGFGFMIGTGGSALVGKTLGEGDREKANQIFSLLIYVSIGLGAVLAVFGIVFIKPISVLLGADEQMLGYCVVYCRILMLALPGFMLQNAFQSFLITAEKPAMGQALLQSCSNGMLELVSNISRSIVSMLYNLQLMKIAGESGVAAYGVIMYVNFIFIAIFIGYSIGTAPIFSFHYGAENHLELKNVYRKSMKLNLAAGVVLTAVAMLLAAPLSKIFVGYDAELYAMTVRGFRLYSLSFLLCGFSIFGSAFFTALNDGVVSAIISFLRTVVFEVLSILILPMLLGLDGVWYSISVAEGAALIVTIYFFITKRKKYHYA